MPNDARIPFNRPFIVGKELFYVSKAVLAGHLAGDGVFTQQVNAWLERVYDAKLALLTNSCTAALEISAYLCNVGPGDEVIMPSWTFVSTANAFAIRGARIRFIDIREDTLNIDESRIEEAITDRTKAIVPVHYAGVSADMEEICRIGKKHGIPVVEDAAQGVNATYQNRYLGTIGELGCYSFHETKNFISGEGGALLINDDKYAERAQIIREKGTNRTAFRKGVVDKYTWIDFGSSYLPSEIVAAFLFAQLEEAETITHTRRAVFSYYAHAFRPLHDRGLLRMPITPRQCRHNAHMFYLIMASREERDGLIRFLDERNIQAVFHYIPLHSSPKGREVAIGPEELPVTDDIAGRLVRLPCYFGLERSDQDRVIEAVEAFVDR
jgi:dTDP-4-amino-4,6-dideoxygalactose transaminase